MQRPRLKTRAESSAVLLLALALLVGCIRADVAPSRCVCLIVDPASMSSLKKAPSPLSASVNALLRSLSPGDRLIVLPTVPLTAGRNETAIQVALDPRPSMANTQKRAVRMQIDALLKTRQPADEANLEATLAMAADALQKRDADQCEIMLATPLQPVPADIDAVTIPLKLGGITVMAVGNRRLDKRDTDLSPSEYWRRRVEGAGGRWQSMEDLSQLALNR